MIVDMSPLPLHQSTIAVYYFTLHQLLQYWHLKSPLGEISVSLCSDAPHFEHEYSVAGRSLLLA